MSSVIRKASPIAKASWWFMTICTCGLWAMGRGYPK
jgi:hypothetical protein